MVCSGAHTYVPAPVPQAMIERVSAVKRQEKMLKNPVSII